MIPAGFLGDIDDSCWIFVGSNYMNDFVYLWLNGRVLFSINCLGLWYIIYIVLYTILYRAYTRVRGRDSGPE